MDSGYPYGCGGSGVRVVGRDHDEVRAVAYVTEDAERKPETPAEEDGTTGLFTALGKMLKRLRERAGLTQRQFGEMVGYGPDAISAMERGVRITRPDLLRKADELLNAGGLLEQAIPEVEEAMKKVRTRHPEWYQGYANLEKVAVSLHDYSTMCQSPRFVETFLCSQFLGEAGLIAMFVVDRALE
ncbi:helix-turn-helix transcriptional regulator, partial [Streptomyces turgidiscabies]